MTGEAALQGTKVSPEVVKELIGDMSPEDKKALHGWYWYDWANQAWALTVLTVIVPQYMTALYNSAHGGGGDSFYAWVNGISMLIVAVSAPLLGIIADRVPIKKKLLWWFTVVGVVACCLMAFTSLMGEYDYYFLAMVTIVGNVGFSIGNTFYYAFMPYLADKRCMDHVSSWGYAYGFMGGSLLLVVHLLVVMRVGIDLGDYRLPFVFITSALWWLGWGMRLFLWTPEPEIPNPTPIGSVKEAATIAVTELVNTLREIRKFKVLAFFLVAYLLFYDGVNTINGMASAFGEEVLRINPMMNIVLLLTVNVVAVPMSIVFGKLANKYGTKKILMSALIIYSGVAVLAVGFAPLEMNNDSTQYDFQYQWNEETDQYDVGMYDDDEGGVPDDYLGTGLHKRVICCVSGGWVALEGEGDQALRETFWDYLANTPQEDTKRGDDVSKKHLSRNEAAALVTAMHNMTDHRFSFFFSEGPQDGEYSVGDHHPTQISGGPVDFWPNAMRTYVWGPLGMGAPLQWIFLGMVVGCVMGAAGAQARSMFTLLIPETRTTEFFGFFGFIGKAAAAIGPIIYAISSGMFDSRVAVLSVTVVILIGTYLTSRIDLEEGYLAAVAEDEKNRGLSASNDSEE